VSVPARLELPTLEIAPAGADAAGAAPAPPTGAAPAPPIGGGDDDAEGAAGIVSAPIGADVACEPMPDRGAV